MRLLLVTTLLVSGCAATPATYDIPYDLATSMDGTGATLVVGMYYGSVVQQTD